MGKLTVRVEAFKPLRSNTLFGFADIVIPELHLRIRELAVHESHGRRRVLGARDRGVAGRFSKRIR